MGVVTDNVTLRLLGAALFLFNPVMILRMGVHMSLAGHFLILAALYLNLRPHIGKHYLAWGTLLAISALVHAYLLVMVALIWIADLLARTIEQQLIPRKSIVELVSLLFVTGFCCWQAGYFTVEGDGLGSFGFGLFRANALTYFDPAGWSYVLNDMPGVPGDGDGIAFPGLGVMLLTVCAFLHILSGNSNFIVVMRKRLILLLVLFGLMVFALSNKIGVGPYEFDYWLPESVISMASIFRASGRMVWPVMYATIFAVIFLTVRGYKPRAAIMLLAIALVIQVSDTRAGWVNIRSLLMASPSTTWKTPLVDPFWQSAASRYQKVRWVSPQNLSAHWMTLSDFAGRYHLATDAVYLGRVSAVAQGGAQRSADMAVASGKYDVDSLYLLDQQSFLQAAVSLDRNADMLAKIDGFYVLAPGWKQSSEGPAINLADPRELIPTFRPGEKIQFMGGSAGAELLAKGWWPPESWGTWSSGFDAEITLRPTARVSSLSLEANALLADKHSHQAVDVRINNVSILSTRLTNATANKIDIVLPASVQELVAEQGVLRIQFHFPHAISPHELGISEDERKLAIGLLALTVY